MAAGADDETALQIATDDQFFDQKAGHDGFAGTGIVGQQIPQGLSRKHRLINRGDLVRQRIHQGGVDGKHRIEQMR